MLMITFLLFAFLAWFSFNLYYLIPMVDLVKYRDDGRVLLWLTALIFGGLPLMIFAFACYFVLYLIELRKIKMSNRPENMILMLVQMQVIFGTYHLLQSLFQAESTLQILTVTFGTVFITQTCTVLLAGKMFNLPIFKGTWRLELLKYNMIDAMYLSFYLIAAAFSKQTERTLWYNLFSLLLLISGVLVIFYWRTIGIRQTTLVKEQVRELKNLNAQLSFANQQVLLAFASSLEKRDPYTAGHSERVAQYAVAIARELNMSDADIELIHLGGLLHDIGKIGIPDYVLNKPDRLTDEEYDIMKQHPVLGEELLREVYAFSNVMTEHDRQRMLEIVLYHHERPDGRGYPAGLRGEEIPLFARLTAVADAFDAMTSSRAYRQAMSVEKAVRILQEGSGTQFWPPAVEAFLRTEEYKLPEVLQAKSLAPTEAAAGADTEN